jgi:hypothetical protein
MIGRATFLIGCSEDMIGRVLLMIGCRGDMIGRADEKTILNVLLRALGLFGATACETVPICLTHRQSLFY